MSLIKKIFNRKMLSMLLLGYSAGLPFLLSGGTLQAWMTREGINLKTLGYISILGIPYTMKLLVAPFLDRYRLPFLGFRKGWMFCFQLGIIGSILALSFTKPGVDLWPSLFWAFMIAVFSSCQDIVIDAYRREILLDEELGLGASLYVNGYRIALWITGGVAFLMAGSMPWSDVFRWLGFAMVPSLLFTVLAPKEEHYVSPQNMSEAIIDPLKEFFTRNGAFIMLSFILFYKLGDSVASNMTIPFFIKMGFTDPQIGTVAKTFGMIATIVGGLLGGILMLRVSRFWALSVFGVLQCVSTLGFILLIYHPGNMWALSSVIAFENIASGLGTAAYAAYMLSITNKKYTATQYALLTSIMAFASKVIPAWAGDLANAVGWEMFFIICTLAAIPGLLLLIPVYRLERPPGATTSQV